MTWTVLTIYRCPTCGNTSSSHGRCRNAFSDECRAAQRMREPVQVIPVSEAAAFVAAQLRCQDGLAITGLRGAYECGQCPACRAKEAARA